MIVGLYTKGVRQVLYKELPSSGSFPSFYNRLVMTEEEEEEVVFHCQSRLFVDISYPRKSGKGRSDGVPLSTNSYSRRSLTNQIIG